ncbi:Helix-turn-helix domain-containing protein, partial [Dysosmobacter welbionis]
DRAVLDDFHKLYQFLPGQVGDTGRFRRQCEPCQCVQVRPAPVFRKFHISVDFARESGQVLQLRAGGTGFFVC